MWICSLPTGILQLQFFPVMGRDNSSLMTFFSRSEFGQGSKKPVGGCCESSSSEQLSAVKSCKHQIPELLVSTLYLTVALLIWSVPSVCAQTSADQGKKSYHVLIY